VYITKFVPWSWWKKSENKAIRKTMEWVDAILFALIAVYFINTFFFQNYQIPTSSLEKSLLVGDFLAVSKVSYGPRAPITPLSFPLAQHTMPVIGGKSYIDKPQWKYRRLKGLGEVKRNDIVVFNFPAGDTVALNQQGVDFYTLSRYNTNGSAGIRSDQRTYGEVVFRPVDRRENYVKRCIGLPGETIELRDDSVYIDGELIPSPKLSQLTYMIHTDGTVISEQIFQELG
ncbi:MAG TPA: signal peptidase I, partial [Porphyromonadaceae bacterium]|nr:signal peptidase I [Porphyromonadaceae bacterium]